MEKVNTDANAGRVKKMSKLDARLQSAQNKLALVNVSDSPKKEYQNNVGVEPDFEKIIDFLDPKFVFEYLVKIINFLQSDTYELYFPNITRFVELFLLNIARDINNLKCGRFDGKCKNVCMSIIAVVEVNKDVYKWKCTHERIIDKDFLVYRKEYISPSRTGQFRAPYSISTTPSQNFVTSTTDNLENKWLNNNQKDLSTAFKLRWLNVTLKFVKDDTQLTLKYPEMTTLQAEFVNSLIMPNNIENDIGFGYKSLYAPLREAIEIFSLKYDFKSNFVETDKANTVCLLFEKIPKENVEEPEDSSRNIKLIKRLIGSADKQMPQDDVTTVTNVQTSVKEGGGNHIPDPSNKLLQAITIPPDNGESSSNEPTSIEPFQSAGNFETRMMDETLVQLMDKRKSRLLQAMSVPVKSDKALRMMSNMGWDGGALGKTGEGITEPIIPALELVSRAGLGHIPAPQKQQKPKTPNNPRKRVCFRVELLQHILNLVISDDTVKEIEYTTPLCKSERGFMKQLLSSTNRRSNMGLENEEKKMWQTMMAEVSRTPNLQISACLSNNKQHIVLTKFEVEHVAEQDSKQKKTQMIHTIVNNSQTVKITDSDIKDIIATMITPYGPIYISKSALIGLTFRVTVMVQTLQFLKSDQSVRQIKFEGKLKQKQRKFITNFIVQVNKREKGGSTSLERDLMSDLRESAVNCCLNIKYPESDRSFILEKIYYQNRFVNTALNTPKMENNDVQNEKCHKNNDINRNRHIENHAESVTNNDKIVTNKIKHVANNKIIEKSDDGDYEEVTFVRLVSSSVMILDSNSDANNDSANNLNLDKQGAKLDAIEPEKLDVQKNNNSIISPEDQIIIKNEKHNGDIIKQEIKGNIQLSPTTKRFKSESLISDDKTFKTKKILITKNVCLVPIDYPKKTADAGFAQKVQTAISNCLDNSKILPLLKCNGIKNGALTYSCHSEVSFLWLENVCVDCDIKIIDTKEFCDPVDYKMAVRVNTFIDESYTRLFNRLELYNEGLRTSEWVLVKKEKYSDYIVVILKMDEKSFNYIKAAGFSLFAGIDQAKFNVIWE